MGDVFVTNDEHPCPDGLRWFEILGCILGAVVGVLSVILLLVLLLCLEDGTTIHMFDPITVRLVPMVKVERLR